MNFTLNGSLVLSYLLRSISGNMTDSLLVGLIVTVTNIVIVTTEIMVVVRVKKIITIL